MHTSEGKYLVTRLVPCPMCLCGLNAPSDHSPHDGGAGGDAAFFPKAKGEVAAARGSRGSAVSDGADSGVGHESPVFSRNQCGDHHLSPLSDYQRGNSTHSDAVFSFTIEECIYQSHGNRHIHCPVHNDIHLAQVAPDTVNPSSNELEFNY